MWSVLHRYLSISGLVLVDQKFHVVVSCVLTCLIARTHLMLDVRYQNFLTSTWWGSNINFYEAPNSHDWDNVRKFSKFLILYKESLLAVHEGGLCK